MAGDLGGRVAIVGLDQPALARRLAAEGATVVLVGGDADAAGVVLAEIEAAGGGRAAFFSLAPPVSAGVPVPDPAEDPAATAPAPLPPSPPPSAWSGPTGPELDALVEFVAGLWPAR
ncbi:MAG: hypothetical protein QOI99_2016 [Actinomycetota bacterium]|nr:hypothetical protein [Actinomycetota bacterium]